MHYDVMLFPAFCWTKCHFRSLDERAVDTSNYRLQCYCHEYVDKELVGLKLGKLPS